MVSAQVRRRQVAFVCERGVSQRRACALMSVARSSLRYESRLAKRDAPVVAAMRELAAQYPRYGYRRIQVFLARRGHSMSADRTHRIWRQHGFQVPKNGHGDVLRRAGLGPSRRSAPIRCGPTISCSTPAPMGSS